MGCCEVVKARVRAVEGVQEVEIDAVRMELIVTRDRSKVTLDQVIETVRATGFEAGKP